MDQQRKIQESKDSFLITLKLKTMCINSVKKLPVLIRYISDKYKTQKMCGEDVVKNCGTLKFVP